MAFVPGDSTPNLSLALLSSSGIVILSFLTPEIIIAKWHPDFRLKQKQQELVILSSDPGPEENDPFILLHLVTLYFWIHASWGEELRDSDETTDPRLTSKLNEVG